jgi:hypothetical protein
MSRNPCLDVASAELSAAGIRDVVPSHGGKHLQIRWKVNGHEKRMYSMAITPSDVNAEHNVRARMLREDGILVDQPKTIEALAPKLPQRVATLEGHVAKLMKDIAELKLKLT